MNPEAKALWTAALRSDEFTQGSGALAVKKRDGSMAYCCLGVLCEVARRNGVAMSIEVSSDGLMLYGGIDLVLPREVQHWADLDSMNPSGLLVENHRYTLAELNDGVSHRTLRPRTFTEIADIIEEQL